MDISQENYYKEMLEAAYMAIHYNSEIIYQSIHRKIAQYCLPTNELVGIYHLSETHAVWDQFKTEFIHEQRQNPCFLEKKCFNEVNVSHLLSKVKEMPKEWTIVQITRKFEVETRYNMNSDFAPTPALYMSVFSCGQDVTRPICIPIDKPKDKLGNPIEILKELQSLVKEQYETLSFNKATLFKINQRKKDYWEARLAIDNRLKAIVKQMESWLQIWICLLMGKFIKEKVEHEINARIDILFKKCGMEDVPERSKVIFSYIVKGMPYNMNKSLLTWLEILFPTFKKSQVTMSTLIKEARNIAEDLQVNKLQRHPVILIVDKTLDQLPWEMLPIIEGHPITRMPSLNLTHILFKEYETKIKDGLVCGFESTNGKYIINPELNLNDMETRIMAFINYWMPTWKGMHGVAPSKEEVESILSDCDIFTFFGHGAGEKYIKGRKVQRIKMNAVVFLFGCASLKLKQLGPQVALEGNCENYLIASCPCVVGNLWEVTDRDEDHLSAVLLSTWIPSKSSCHWSNIDHKLWEQDGRIKPAKGKDSLIRKPVFEAELLRAVCIAKKSAKLFTTQAAIVVRGLPVKINV